MTSSSNEIKSSIITSKSDIELLLKINALVLKLSPEHKAAFKMLNNQEQMSAVINRYNFIYDWLNGQGWQQEHEVLRGLELSNRIEKLTTYCNVLKELTRYAKKNYFEDVANSSFALELYTAYHTFLQNLFIDTNITAVESKVDDNALQIIKEYKKKLVTARFILNILSISRPYTSYKKMPLIYNEPLIIYPDEAEKTLDVFVNYIIFWATSEIDNFFQKVKNCSTVREKNLLLVDLNYFFNLEHYITYHYQNIKIYLGEELPIIEKFNQAFALLIYKIKFNNYLDPLLNTLFNIEKAPKSINNESLMPTLEKRKARVGEIFTLYSSQPNFSDFDEKS